MVVFVRLRGDADCYAKNSFDFPYEVGPPRFESSRTYEPSSFFLILYTMNITKRIAHKRPTIAPQMMAVKKVEKDT